MATIKRIGNTGLRLFCDCDQFVHEITVNGKNVEVFSSKVGKGKKEDKSGKKKERVEERDPFVDFITGRGKEEREEPDDGDEAEADGSDNDEDK